jgi:hypothetical protein
MAFVEHCLELSSNVAMLLRLNFLASKKRNPFMREHCPNVYVLSDRPSFTGKGTDSIEYAWFVWESNARKSSGRIQVLPPTSPAERRQPEVSLARRRLEAAAGDSSFRAIPIRTSLPQSTDAPGPLRVRHGDE